MNRNHAIRIIGGIGCCHTSLKRATRFIQQGRARYIDDQTIEMIAEDHRHCSALRSVEESKASLQSQPTPLPVGYHYEGSENLRTFAPYPDSEIPARRRRCGKPYVFGRLLAIAAARSGVVPEAE